MESTEHRKYKKDLNLRHEPVRFMNRDFALGWSEGTEKLSMVMHGCDGKFWVVCLADATRLNNLGYEYVA